MIAVLKHELRNYFHSFTAYVFGAFLLAIRKVLVRCFIICRQQ